MHRLSPRGCDLQMVFSRNSAREDKYSRRSAAGTESRWGPEPGRISITPGNSHVALRPQQRLRKRSPSAPSQCDSPIGPVVGSAALPLARGLPRRGSALTAWSTVANSNLSPNAGPSHPLGPAAIATTSLGLRRPKGPLSPGSPLQSLT